MSLTKVSYSMIQGASVNVLDYGADLTGSTDSTSAIQAAVNAITTTGGSIYFPFGKYKITSQITIASARPICLYGEMGNGNVGGGGSRISAGLIIGANITGSMIKFVSPTANRGEAGGGRVTGLAFYDETYSGNSVGSYTCTSALELYDFPCSSVDNCIFEGINGSAIYGEFTVMTNIENNIIRYCGGSGGKHGLNLKSSDPSYYAQSMLISGNKFEVINTSYYVYTGANSSECKFIGNGFEAESSFADSNHEFMYIAGGHHSIANNHFNRNTGTQVHVDGSNNSIVGNTFRGGPYSTTAMIIDGNNNTYVGNTHRSARTGLEIYINGTTNVISSNTLYYSGAIRYKGNCNNITNNNLLQCVATTANLGLGDDYWINEESNVSTNNIISNNVLDNNNGPVTTTGGIRIQGSNSTVLGNMFRAFVGTGNGAKAIESNSSSVTIQSNVESSVTTLINATSIGVSDYSNNVTTTVGSTAIPLTASGTYDPPSLNNGDSAVTTLSVTGAVAGDYVSAAFGQPLQGIIMTAWVSANNTVTVSFENQTGGTIDLGSGTLKVKVSKR